MYPVPDDILSQFNALLDKKSVPVALHEDYRKWLRYFLDFRAKYSPPAERSKQVRQFIEKLRSKDQSGKSLHYAAHALSLFFSLRSRVVRSVAHTTEPRSASSSSVEMSAPSGEQPSGQTAQAVVRTCLTVLAASRLPAQRPGRKYSEWWSLERTQSPEWDGIIDTLAGEIKARHYSRKTLKAYADWSRKFQLFLKHKTPAEVSAADVKAYLTYLAVNCKVSASTQNQSFNALLFLFRHILKKDFGVHKDAPRAKRSTYIPVVLTRQEIYAVLKNLAHPYDLVVKLLYGCGLPCSNA